MNIILASQSPRRQELLKGMGFEFTTRVLDIDESFPEYLKGEEIVVYLSEKKADAINDILDNELIITADTVVCLADTILNKPADRSEAMSMLQAMSDRMHIVYTGVCLKTKNAKTTFYDKTNVYFKKLTDSEIEYYIDNYRPFDKAGSYGVQEWIGYIGIERIEGSFYNVMGLPTAKLYDEIRRMI